MIAGCAAWRTWLGCGVVAVLSGCAHGSTACDVALGVTHSIDVTFAPNDATTADAARGSTADVGSGKDTASARAGSPPAANAGPDPACGKAPGCPCHSAKHCLSGHCIDTAYGARCVHGCEDGCPVGESCRVLLTGEVVCVAALGNLCAPCHTDAACQITGHPKAVCVSYGAQGSFCGLACDTNADCPAGHVCSLEGAPKTAPSKQCVLVGATCACSDAAVATGRWTHCSATHDAVTCWGTRRCAPAGEPGAPAGGGLTACDAPAPVTEVCDGVDNDCNGATDEVDCDDANPCTIDLCEFGGACEHLPKSGDACAKGICKNGVCSAP